MKGEIGRYQFEEKPKVFSDNHPNIILNIQVPATLGQISAGTVIGVDTTNGSFVVYDPSAVDANGNPIHKPYGVIVEDLDTSNSTLARVLVFGVVYEDAINVKGNPPTSEDKEALRALNIYVIERI